MNENMKCTSLAEIQRLLAHGYDGRMEEGSGPLDSYPHWLEKKKTAQHQ